jgi:hypothetical protein
MRGKGLAAASGFGPHPGRAVNADLDRLRGGPPAPPKFGEKVVAAIKWVDGTVIDCAREVQIRGAALAAGGD